MTTAVKDPRNIKRIPLTHIDNVEAELRGSVLTKAHEMFGYTADSFSAFGPLARVLGDLGIAPLDSEAVSRYQKSKEKDVTMRKRVAYGWAVALFPFLVAVALVYYGHAFTTWFTATDGLAWLPIIGGSGTLGFILNMTFHLHLAEKIKDVRIQWHWKSFTLDKTGFNGGPVPNYPRYIPVHILNMAVQIKESLPTSQFFVEELTETVTKVPMPMPDPFLLVRNGSEHYYVAVWDEREFEAKM